MTVQVPAKHLLTLTPVCLVILLVYFLSSSVLLVALVLLGGGVFVQSFRGTQRVAEEVQLQGIPRAIGSPSAQLLSASPAAQEGTLKQKEETAANQSSSPVSKQIVAGQINFGRPPVASAADTAPAQSPAETERERAPIGLAATEAPPQGIGAPLAGGAAVLARFRQQRAQSKAAPNGSVKPEAAKEVVVAYASQTGTAQEIAKGIQAESASHGIKSKVLSLNELGFEDLVAGKIPFLVIVAASTGDGDAPDNAAKFYATMKRRTQAQGILKGVKFTCLGLGDSNYTRFMGVSRALRSRLQELGADTFYKMGEADEVDGIESIVDPWVEGLWASLKELLDGSKGGGKAADASVAAANGNGITATTLPGAADLQGVPALTACRVALRWMADATESAGIAAMEAAHPTEEELTMRNPEGVYSPSAPFWAPVTSATYLTAPSSDRQVLHLEIDISSSGMEYQPGDSLGVTPLNSSALVDGLLHRLGADGGKVFSIVPADSSMQQKGLLPHLGCPCTLRRALQAGCDLTSMPRKSLLRLLAEYCSDPKEQHALLHLSSRGGRDTYNNLVTPISPSLLDLLNRFPSCKPPLAALLDALSPLAPRLYSVSSSPLQHSGSAHVAFSVVRIGSPLPNTRRQRSCLVNGISNGDVAGTSGRWGVATGWLERQVEPLLAGEGGVAVRLPVHLRQGGAFRHPDDLSAPVVMIGPGTGVTPFRGFLQHRRQLSKTEAGGPAWLYFGCRRPDEDFLYRDDLEDFVRDGTLTRLETAFSRAGPEKVYVQQCMLKQAKDLYPLLSHPKAHIFVCGDGAKMAKDVHTTLAQILEKQGGMSEEESAAYLASLTQARRQQCQTISSVVLSDLAVRAGEGAAIWLPGFEILLQVQGSDNDLYRLAAMPNDLYRRAV